MDASRCTECTTRPVMGCGRCNTTRCMAHALAAGERCNYCERDWDDDAVTRRAAKMIFVPPVAILSAGLLFGLFLPVSIGGAIGAAILCALACVTGIAAGTAVSRLVDRSARAMFLREHGGGLPAARLLSSQRHR